MNFYKSLEIINKCIECVGGYFTPKGTWDYTKEELESDNIIIVSNDDLTYFSILRIEDDYIHYNFSWLKEDLRGKGYGTQAIKEIIEYCKANYTLNIRATARISNFASCKSLLNAGFYVASSDLIENEIGYEFIYNNFQFDGSKYVSTKPSSCGLSALSFILDYKYHKYIKPDNLNLICFPNKGIPKGEMLNTLQHLLKSFDYKVISNFHMSSDDCKHLLENHLTNKQNIALCCIDSGDHHVYDFAYEHWSVIIEDLGTHFRTYDSERGFDIIQKPKYIHKMMLSNMFTILL